MAYRCSVCGFSAPKWMGFCPQCRTDTPLEPEAASASTGRKASRPAPVIPLTAADADATGRAAVGIGEVDRVLGGGLVAGAAVLIGGEPGIGKSTLLLQIAGSLSADGGTVLIASAEESPEQVGLRARRLGISSESVLLSAERDVDAIVAAAGEVRPDLLVVDSIQTVAADEVGGAPGGVAQVRESTARLVHFAKESGVPVVLVGHVTKDGSIAGPKLVEHAVDVVLYLEGDPERGLRVLRSLKNRFGATHQVGLFEMGERGLAEVADPSGRLLDRWRGGVPGSVVFPAMDGRRPLLVEVQALVAPSAIPQARRSVRGLEAARLHQVLAVLDRHAGQVFSGAEVYVNVVGGIRVREPAVDLAVAVALVSSLQGRALDPIAVWGEVGLTGEVRPVAHADRRRDEAARLGITRVVAPNGGVGRIDAALRDAGLASGR